MNESSGEVRKATLWLHYVNKPTLSWTFCYFKSWSCNMHKTLLESITVSRLLHGRCICVGTRICTSCLTFFQSLYKQDTLEGNHAKYMPASKSAFLTRRVFYENHQFNLKPMENQIHSCGVLKQGTLYHLEDVIPRILFTCANKQEVIED
ncbi:hypothetical protein Pelo_6435 [Pelomyxa schiedti]|nr:hypothetical protein Pelo_6435 [Pelomyxa schiedti]